jgi:hypothetical protein
MLEDVIKKEGEVKKEVRTTYNLTVELTFTDVQLNDETPMTFTKRELFNALAKKAEPQVS